MSLPDTTIYEIKIALQGTHPQIWRRVQVPANIRLDQLHRVFQIAMGWTNSHIHSFAIAGAEYTLPSEEVYLRQLQMLDERRVRLGEEVTEAKARFAYTYDFGDNWQHEATVEKVLASFPNTHYPLCMDGKGACPPEDCGGVEGFQEMLNILADPLHLEHEDTKSRVGWDFDPESFDLETVNKKLRRLRV